jgi:transposase
MSQIIRMSLEQKHRFVLAALEPVTSMAQLCRTWHLSRQTGYKWLRRYQRGGLAALQEQSRMAHHRPHTLSALWGQRIENLRRRHPFWGPKKLRAVLRRQHPRARLPALSTIGSSLRRLGLVTPRRRRLRGPVVRTRRARPAARPNDVWTADFKGWFTTTDGRRVDPLTVRDLASRFGLLAQMLAGPQFLPVQQAFVRLFRQHGQPPPLSPMNSGIACSKLRPHGRQRAPVRRKRPAPRAGYATITKCVRMKLWIRTCPPNIIGTAAAVIAGTNRGAIHHGCPSAGLRMAARSSGRVACALSGKLSQGVM